MAQTIIRTTLTTDEWSAVKRLAESRHLSASQLVAQTMRELLAKEARKR